MRILIIFSLLLSHISFAQSNSIKERVTSISSLISNSPDSAFNLALELKSYSEDIGNSYGIVQSNYILAYILDDEQGDYGKAIIHYLEAIRYAENSNFEGVERTLISLHKNCGVVFRKFKAFDLAQAYYSRAISLAEEQENTKQIVSLNYNLSFVLKEQKKSFEAIETLNKVLPYTEKGSKKYFDILNEIGVHQQILGHLDLSISTFSTLLHELPTENTKMRGYALHNMGISHKQDRNTAKALECFRKSLEIKAKLTSQSSLFSTYQEIGNIYFENGNFNESIKNFSMAEKLISSVTQNPESFKLYKSIANLYFATEQYEQSKYYEDLHSKSFNEYLSLQDEIRKADQRYNIELITKRYFAEVEKQDRIAEIMFASKLTSGSLLALLLLVIGYHRYQKITLRRSIERELISLKIID